MPYPAFTKGQVVWVPKGVLTQGKHDARDAYIECEVVVSSTPVSPTVCLETEDEERTWVFKRFVETVRPRK